MESIIRNKALNYLKHCVGLLALFLLLNTAFAFTAEGGELIDMSIIAKIESNNNPLAVSPCGAIGTYQIMYIVLVEYNTLNNAYYTSQDLYNEQINYTIAYWYMNTRIPQLLRHFHKPITIDNCLISYNAGVGAVLSGKIPKETRQYLIKYHKLERN